MHEFPKDWSFLRMMKQEFDECSFNNYPSFFECLQFKIFRSKKYRLKKVTRNETSIHNVSPQTFPPL